MRNKLRELRKEYEKKIEVLIDSCDNNYDKCAIYAEIGEDFDYIERGNKYLDRFIDCRLENGHRHETITFEGAVEYIEDWYGEEAVASVAKFFADNKMKSMTLDW